MNTIYVNDRSRMLPTILKLIAQIKSVFSDKQWRKFKLPKHKINKIVISGMGSSLIAFKIVNSLYKNKLKIPTYCVNGFDLPEWTDENTLIIFSSYSGNSKEVLSCAKQALNKNSEIIVISSGGRLIKIVGNKSLFTYTINKELNFCGQPRMAVGSSLGIFLNIFYILGVINIDIISLILGLDRLEKKLLSKRFNNQNELIAKKISNHSIDIISAGFAEGSIQLFSRQLHWNSKHQSASHLAPEAMHYFLEGLNFPNTANKRFFLILYSSLFQKEEKKDLSIIEDYLRLNKLRYLTIKSKEKTKLLQTIDFLLMSSLISFYLSVVNNFDPTPTPAIEFYKNYSRIK